MIWGKVEENVREGSAASGHVGVYGLSRERDGSRTSGKIWDTTTGNELLTLAGHTAEVTDVAWNSAGTRIATASADGTAKIWAVD